MTSGLHLLLLGCSEVASGTFSGNHGNWHRVGRSELSHHLLKIDRERERERHVHAAEVEEWRYRGFAKNWIKETPVSRHSEQLVLTGQVELVLYYKTQSAGCTGLQNILC